MTDQDKPSFIGQVRYTEANDWKYVTVPKDSPIHPGQYVKVIVVE